MGASPNVTQEPPTRPRSDTRVMIANHQPRTPVRGDHPQPNSVTTSDTLCADCCAIEPSHWSLCSRSAWELERIRPFSLWSIKLFRHLPVKAPEQLVLLNWSGWRLGTSKTVTRIVIRADNHENSMRSTMTVSSE